MSRYRYAEIECDGTTYDQPCDAVVTERLIGQAVKRAHKNGWLLTPNGDYCPEHRAALAQQATPESAE